MLKLVKTILLTMLIQLNFSSETFAIINVFDGNLNPNELLESALNLPISYYLPVGNGNYAQEVNETQAKIQKDLM